MIGKRHNPASNKKTTWQTIRGTKMEKTYLWLAHDYLTHDVELSESTIRANCPAIQNMVLNKRYNMFVINKKDIADFYRKLEDLFPYEFKTYEFSENEMLIGEHYVDPLRNINVFIPWTDAKTPFPPNDKEYRYFFFADFNTTFEVTDNLLNRYLDKCQCQFDVIGCVKTEPAFYTGDSYYLSKVKVQMHYADVLLIMGLLFKMVVENHQLEDEGSMTLLYGQFNDGSVRVFDRWCIANIWTLSHDASFGHEMPLFCHWEFEQAIRQSTET
ncbi:hypothetical protein IVG45_02170 [Methylomonas sp. LL1]|uniref:hypothetical protein n=1 Tax=Methylomonas sp. LL1 TaxID=2785785 RepID=UPI0018C43099|nr:hypothetical protein [Methylomonas sp. LL1]QPK63806.1 hypothetical protein IVG45_02170 [Methylomonas sp. LL1]